MNAKAIKNNLELCEEFKEQIEDNDARWHGGPSRFKCVKCGGDCTFGNFRFCGNDPRKVVCYGCQRKVN